MRLLVIAILLSSCQIPTQEVETVEVANRAPTVEIIAPDEVTAESEATLQADGYDPDGDELRYEWTIDSRTIETEAVRIQPLNEGRLKVTVKATDGEAEATDSRIIDVLPKPWMPEPCHVYVLDATIEEGPDAIEYDIACYTQDGYNDKLQLARQVASSHNQDYPNQPWEAVGGGWQ